jgi:hypothetical protein
MMHAAASQADSWRERDALPARGLLHIFFIRFLLFFPDGVSTRLQYNASKGRRLHPVSHSPRGL